MGNKELSSSTLLVSFPKMKRRLIRSVCLSPLITFEINGNLDEILCGGDAMVGNLDATTFNPIALTILKWLRFKVMMWVHHSALLNSGLGLITLLGFCDYITYHLQLMKLWKRVQRAWMICDANSLDVEINHLKRTFRQNGYSNCNIKQALHHKKKKPLS
jgi:hypothetical protein